jgi:hypothetical protein
MTEHYVFEMADAEELQEEIDRLDEELRYYVSIIDYLQNKLALYTDEEYCICQGCVTADERGDAPLH